VDNNDILRTEHYLRSNLPIYMDLLKQMVAINSFSANPSGVNELGIHTAHSFTPLGFEAEFIQSADPSYGKHLFLSREPKSTQFKGAQPNSLAMISHLDTVFSRAEEEQNNFYWRKAGNRLYGPGTVDIKGGTVMIYMILDSLQSLFPQIYDSINWHICIDACEEVLSDDFGTLCLRRLPESTLACLVFEGGTINSEDFMLVVARKGRSTFQIKVEGKSAHAGNAHAQGANAIVQIAHTIDEISKLTDYSNDLTFNVGTVGGGTTINRVPHYAEAGVEMRAFSTSVFQVGIENILSLSNETNIASVDGFPCTVSVQPIYQTAPWSRNPNTDSIFNLWSESAKHLDITVLPESRGGLSDGNFLWERFPTLDGLGPSGANAHCSERTPDGSKDQEYVLESSFVPKALLNIISIMKLAKS